ncbi:MAG: family 10 glycosylhydrolase [Candidatus Sumerlaeaceae bacterium]
MKSWGRGLLWLTLFWAACAFAWARSPEYRVMWVSRFEWPSADPATAKANVDNIMQTLAANGFNAVLFQVRGQCDVHYPSPYEPWASTYGWTDPGWDPLAYAIQSAHARGLEFHAYINTHTLAQGTPPANTVPQHPYNLHGPNVPLEQSWVIRDQSGATATSDNYTWISPGIPEASWWVRRAIMHVVENYDVDGVHFDRIRTPGPQYSYDPITVARFNGDGNPDGLAWGDFMRSQITRDLRHIYGEIQWKKKKVKVSAAPFGIVYKDATTNYQGTGTQSYFQWYQDSWGWMSAHVVDFMVPQIYWEVGSSHPFELLLADWLNHAAGRYVVAGSTTDGGTKLASSLLAEYQQTVQQNAAGHCIFSFSTMGPYWTTFVSGPYASPAQIPDMPWKSAPTTGNIVGYVRDKNGFPVLDAKVNRVGDPYNYLSAYDGFFAILEVPTSVPLTLTASKAGKGKATATGIVVATGETTVITLTLSLSEGSVKFDKAQYQFGELARIRLDDDDLEGTGTVSVKVSSPSEPTGETVMLDEGTTPGQFFGSILLVGEGATQPNDGTLKVSVGDVVTCTYEDANRGDGTPTTTTATATIIAPPDIILESRTPSGAVTPAPFYQEYITTSGAWANTTAKSQAPGLQAPGSRFTATGSLGAYAVWRPHIITPGLYDVYITLANAVRGPNNDSPGAGFVVQHLKGTTAGTFDLSKNNPAITDKWMLLASDVPLGPGTNGSLTIINNNPNSSATQRFCMDAVKFVFKGFAATGSGMVSFDKGKYGVPAVATVRLTDANLMGVGSATVFLTSGAEVTTEALALSEIGATGVFEGTIALALGMPVSGDGILQVNPLDVIVATYNDADNGTGTPAVATATALVDGVPPSISNIEVTNIQATQATVNFVTDEPSTAVVRYGQTKDDLHSSVRADSPSQSFSVPLSGLLSDTTYYFIVEAADEVGNLARADQGGQAYSFRTSPLTYGLTENFDTQPDQWSKSGLWRLVGADDACLSPASPPYCYHYAKPDTCTYETGGINKGSLISPEFVVPPLGELTFASREWTEGSTTLWDTRKIYVLTNNGTTRNLLAQLTGSGWEWYVAGPFSLAAYADQVVALEFEFDTKDAYLNSFPGWAVDDVLVESADKLVVSSGFLDARGNIGGPFEPAAVEFALWNKGMTPIEWATSQTVSWFDLSQTSGTLAPDERTTITVALNDEALSLPEGLHVGSVSFYNVATSLMKERKIQLTVENPPAAPSDLRATSVTQTAIALEWIDQADNETTYVLLRARAGEGLSPRALLPANSTSFFDSGLDADTSYTYVVRAVNSWGYSPPSNVLDVLTLPWPPAQPTNLHVCGVTQTQVCLAWSDEAENETAYEIERDTGSGFEHLATLPADSDTFTDPSLDAEMNVLYRVRAVNAGGASLWSNRVEVRTLPWAPAIPLNLSAALVDGHTQLTWIDASTNETGFELEWQVDDGPFLPLANLPPNTSSYIHSLPAPGTRNSYRVRAINAGGASDWSNTAEMITPLASTFVDGPQGWTLHGIPSEVVTGDFDAECGALRLRVSSSSQQRILGWQSPRLPLTGKPETIYRFKAYVFRSGQANMGDPRQVPNMRLRCSVRYAMNSMLEMFWHLALDPTSDVDMLPNIPSSDPQRPTAYRVDLDPVDVPALDPVAAPNEGVQGMFEVYSLEPQENGSLELAEAALMALPAPASVRPLKTYVTGPNDAGDLRRGLYMRSTLGGTVPLPTIDDSTTYGLILDSTACSPDDVAVAVAEIDPGADLATRVRVEPGRQYRVRWHVVSPRQTNLQAQLRLRLRTLRFAWSQKLELGGAWAAGPVNNAIAQQALPGVGTGNPAKRGDELPAVLDGGWYTMYFHGPPVVPLKQPGPGVPRPSRRDVKCGVDVIDTLTHASEGRSEGGLFFVDAIEVADFPTLPD